MNDTQPRLCFSYLRFSRSEQAKGNSTKRQTDLREAYCARHNLVLDASRMITDKGVSAYNGKNLVAGNLAAFLNMVKAGMIPTGSVLLIESIDRFSRDQIKSARNAMENLLEAGIEIHTLQPERVYNKDSLQDLFTLILMLLEFSRAHDYSVQLGNRLSAAWSAKREKAKANKTPLSKYPPAWLQLVNGKYEIIRERAKVVKLIYKLCADGMGVNLITKELIRRQIPPFTRKSTGKKWTEVYVGKVLMGEAAIGHHQPIRHDHATGKKIPTERIENLYPAVISETLNAQAKVAMRSRKNKGGRVNLDGKIHPFSGLLVTHTGAALQIKYRAVGRNDPQMVPFLVDRSNGNSYPLSNFEFITLGWLAKYEPEPIHKQSEEITDLEAAIAQLDLRIITLQDKINSGEEFTSLLELLTTAEKERKLSKDRLAQVQAITPASQGVTIVEGIFERLGDHTDHTKQETNLELRAVLRRMIDQIQVTIGQEHRFWNKKSLRVTVTFRDGNKAQFSHRV